MAKRFPITEAEFWEWLRAKPRAKAGRGRCPIGQAAFDLTGQPTSLTRTVPWVWPLANWIDALTHRQWNKFTRGQLLKLLENNK